MKELSIEKKAKAYDEAIEKLRSLHDNYDTVSTLIDIKEELEDIFPELAESKDERIRKFLAKCVKGNMFVKSFMADGFDKDEVLAWLEKQGKNNMGISEATKKKLEDNLNKALEKETPESCNEFLEKQGKQKPVYVRTTGYWHVEDIEQKPAEWSEEDERHVNSLLKRLEGLCRNEFERTRFAINEDEDWLRSLKDRYIWKPSIAQLNALSIVSKGNAPDDIEAIVSLYNELKKLRGK